MNIDRFSKLIGNQTSALDQANGLAGALYDSVKHSSAHDLFNVNACKQANMFMPSASFIDKVSNAAELAAIEASYQVNMFADIKYQALDRYRLPELEEAVKLMTGDAMKCASSVIDFCQQDISSFQKLIQSVESPWLDTVNPIQSLAGYTGLLGIGHSIQELPSFSNQLSDMLRNSLGDWRSMVIDDASLMTSHERMGLYEAKGFDSRLSDFPDETFYEVVIIAGMDDIPPIVSAYKDNRELGQDDEIVGLSRANRAHAVIYRFETHMRQFIDENMSRTYGVDWIRTHLNSDIRKGWEKKRNKALYEGAKELPLIAYTDIGDYLRIITNKIYWNDVFNVFFNRKDSVTESFNRLFPIRNPTMHSRPINQSDLLFLHAETTRILMAIGRMKRC